MGAKGKTGSSTSETARSHCPRQKHRITSQSLTVPRLMRRWWRTMARSGTGIAIVNGEAQILHVRKSSKYIFDINFCVEFSCGFATSSRSTSGKVKVLELANVTVKDGTKLPVEISAESDSDKRAAETALVPALEASLQEYITEYQAQGH